MSLGDLLEAFAKVLSWHLQRYYTVTPSRRNDKTFSDDEDASLDDMLQSRIDLSFLGPA